MKRFKLQVSSFWKSFPDNMKPETRNLKLKTLLRKRTTLHTLRFTLHASEGASAVEFALVLPLLLMLLLGIVEFGTLFYRQAIVAWSSREAARIGIVQAVPKPTAGQIEAVVSSVLNKAGLGAAPVTVTVTGAGGAFGTDLTVLVESPYRFQFVPALVPGMRSSVMIRGRTVMRNE